MGDVEYSKTPGLKGRKNCLASKSLARHVCVGLRGSAVK